MVPPSSRGNPAPTHHLASFLTVCYNLACGCGDNDDKMDDDDDGGGGGGSGNYDDEKVVADEYC